MQSIPLEDGDGDVLSFEIDHGRIVPTAVMVPKETPRGVGFVDQISFTFRDDLHHNKPLCKRLVQLGGIGVCVADEEVIERNVGPMLRHIFGLKISHKRSSGLNFYRDTWVLDGSAGMVSIGGQGGTILVQITGVGMALARDGWQERLQAMAQLLNRFVITRLDLAYDDHEGTRYGVDQCKADYEAGLFAARGRPPEAEQKGNWLRINGKGRSFYVGRRENGKLLRVYEKGMQLGEAFDPWVRVELELHNKDRVIPFDAIFNPGAYLAGSYKALAWVSNGEPTNKIATICKVAKMTYDDFLKHFARSYGGLVKVILECEEQALDRLAGLARGRPIPKRLDLALSGLTLV